MAAKSFGIVQTFGQWKWKILRTRRYFFANMLSIFLTLVWAVIAQRCLGVDDIIGLSSQFEGKVLPRSSQFYNSLPTVLFFIHGVTTIAHLISKRMRDSLHESHGKRLMQCSALSLLVAAFYASEIAAPETYFSMHVEELNHMMNITFTMVVAVGMTIFHHIGFSLHISIVFDFISILLWIVFMEASKMSPVGVLMLLSGATIFYVSSTVQEYEYKLAFTRHKEAQSKKSGMKGAFPVQDVAFALSTIDKSIRIIHEIMENDGLLASDLVKDKEGVHIWNKRLACLHEQRIICQSIFAAISSNETLPDLGELKLFKSEFNFRNICTKLFGMFESSFGSSLPLYTDDLSGEMFVNAPQGIFEIVIFLLIYDTVRGASPGICSISCESHDRSFRVIVQNTILEESEKFWGENNRLPNLPSLLPDTFAFGKISSMEKLAKLLAEKYLDSGVVIDFLEPENKSGLSISRRTMLLTEDMASSVQAISLSSSFKSGIIQNWILVQEKAHDIDFFSGIKEKLTVLAIPVSICASDELRTMTEKRRVVVLNEAHLIAYHDALSRDIPNAAFAMLILYDANESTSDDIISKYPNIPYKRLSTKCTIAELYHCIQDLSCSHGPRPSYDEETAKTIPGVVGFQSLDRGSSSDTKMTNHHRYTEQSRGRAASLTFPIRSKSKSHQHHRQQQEVTISRWLGLLRRFEGEITSQQPHHQQAICDDIIEGCKQRIERMNLDPLDPFSRDLAYDSTDFLISDEMSSAVIHALDPQQRRTKFILDHFSPLLTMARRYLMSKKFPELTEFAKECAKRSSDIGAKLLHCWFTTLHEVTSVISIYYMNNMGPNKLQDILEDASGEEDNGDATTEPMFPVTSIGASISAEVGSWKMVTTGKSFDQRVTAIIADIIDAIEIAVWDAAVDLNV